MGGSEVMVLSGGMVERESDRVATLRRMAGSSSMVWSAVSYHSSADFC